MARQTTPRKPKTPVASRAPRRPAPRRRTQDERSSATRERLLEAAFLCLVEAGFSGTTTTLVCRRSRLSRGALLHHFPVKADLLAASAEYVLQRRLADFRAAFQAAPADSRNIATAIDLMWREFSSGSYYAWLELVMASRTDRALRELLSGVSERFAVGVQDAYDAIIPPPPGARVRRTAPAFAFAVLKGLAVDHIVMEDEEYFVRVVNLLKTLASTIPAGVVEQISGR